LKVLRLDQQVISVSFYQGVSLKHLEQQQDLHKYVFGKVLVVLKMRVTLLTFYSPLKVD